ncbi:hypothetical protein [Methanoregula sp.]|uniref:hypothetical protein n=1 Tax=Methanoregula sp. TaxID=2052170 RepID=UPI0035678E39
MTGFCTRIPSVLSNGRLLVPLTAGICLILLTVVLKNVLLVPAEQLSSTMILYIIIYMGFIVSYPFADKETSGSSTRTVLWMGACILMTLGIIAVYAI